MKKTHSASLTQTLSLLHSETAHMPVCVRNCKISLYLWFYVVYLGKVPIKGKSYTSAFSHCISPPTSYWYAGSALLFHNISLSVLRRIHFFWLGLRNNETICCNLICRRYQPPISKLDWLYYHSEIRYFSIPMSEWKSKASTHLYAGGCSSLWTQHILGSTSLPMLAGTNVYHNTLGL